jgi:hypothetical protein
MPPPSVRARPMDTASVFPEARIRSIANALHGEPVHSIPNGASTIAKRPTKTQPITPEFHEVPFVSL